MKELQSLKIELIKKLESEKMSQEKSTKLLFEIINIEKTINQLNKN